MKIYTKTGDKGKTSLYTGKRVPKNDPTIEAIGTVDECNSAIGAAIAHLPSHELFLQIKDQLTAVQHSLFDLGAHIATPRTEATEKKLNRTRFDGTSTEFLETWIDQMEETLTPLTTFILPGGHPAGALLHLARSICRRAERIITPLNSESEVSPDVMIYLNRLSDYLFVLSRYVNHLCMIPEALWHPHA